MEYSITRAELANDCLCRTLIALDSCLTAHGLPLFVVGARARDIAMKLLKGDESKRRTEDLDVAVAIENWQTVISGVQGLADYLGCGKSMAFSIIKDGVLKKEGIQYMVGKCWKFNRQKLDEHLKMHPEMLSRIRCKR